MRSARQPAGSKPGPKRTIKQDDFAVRIALILFQKRAGDAGRSVNFAVHQHRAVFGRGVAQHEHRVLAGQFLERAVVVENRAGAPEEVNVALDMGVADVGRAINLDGVLKAVKIAMADDELTGATENNRFGLVAAAHLGGRVAHA